MVIRQRVWHRIKYINVINVGYKAKIKNISLFVSGFGDIFKEIKLVHVVNKHLTGIQRRTEGTPINFWGIEITAHNYF